MRFCFRPKSREQPTQRIERNLKVHRTQATVRRQETELQRAREDAPCRALWHASAHLERIAPRLLQYFRQFVPVLAPLAAHPSFAIEALWGRHPNSPLQKLMAELTVALEEKHRKGEIDCSDVRTVDFNLMAVAYNLASFERIGAHKGEFSRSAVHDLVRLLWRGIAPAAERGQTPG